MRFGCAEALGQADLAGGCQILIRQGHHAMGVNGLTDHVEIRVAGAVKVNTENFGQNSRY